MIQVTEKAREQLDAFFARNEELSRSIRIFLQEGG